MVSFPPLVEGNDALLLVLVHVLLTSACSWLGTSACCCLCSSSACCWLSVYACISFACCWPCSSLFAVVPSLSSSATLWQFTAPWWPLAPPTPQRGGSSLRDRWFAVGAVAPGSDSLHRVGLLALFVLVSHCRLSFCHASSLYDVCSRYASTCFRLCAFFHCCKAGQTPLRTSHHILVHCGSVCATVSARSTLATFTSFTWSCY